MATKISQPWQVCVQAQDVKNNVRDVFFLRRVKRLSNLYQIYI